MSFSKSKSSTSSSNQTTDTTISTVDNRAVQGDNAVIGGNVEIITSPGANVQGLTITSSDYGAVQAGIGAAMKALDTIKESNAVNNQAVLSAVDKSLTLAGNSTAAAGAITTQSFIKYGAIVAVIGLVAFAVAKFAKK